MKRYFKYSRKNNSLGMKMPCKDINIAWYLDSKGNYNFKFELEVGLYGYEKLYYGMFKKTFM